MFSIRHFTVEVHGFRDEILLLALTSPDSPQVRLFELLKQATKRARLAHRIFMAWQTLSRAVEFPPPEVCALITSCCDAIVQNRFSCHHWGNFRFCPISMLSLLFLRLGCTISNVCCSVFCYICCDYPDLVADVNCDFVLAEKPQQMNGHARVVTIAQKPQLGDTPLFTFRPIDAFTLFVSVRDTVMAAKHIQCSSLRYELL